MVLVFLRYDELSNRERFLLLLERPLKPLACGVECFREMKKKNAFVAERMAHFRVLLSIRFVFSDLSNVYVLSHFPLWVSLAATPCPVLCPSLFPGTHFR